MLTYTPVWVPKVISSRMFTPQGLIDHLVFWAVFLALFHAFKHYYELYYTVRDNQNTLHIKQHVLASRHYHGIEVPQDKARAIALWEQAAAQGHAQSQYHLGTMYMRGDSVTQDIARAVVLLEQSASQGYLESQTLLGITYYTQATPGFELKTSVEAALRKRGIQHSKLRARGMALLEQAAAQGNENALKFLDGLH